MLLTQQTIIIAAASQDAFVGFSVSLHLSYKKWLFFVLSSAYLVVFIQNVAITVVTPDVMQDLGLSSGDMGLLGSVYLYAYALTQVFSGILSTRFGPRRLLSCQFLVAALGGFLFATAHSLPMAVAGRLLNGLGMAGVMSSSFTLFSRWFAPETFSRLCTLFFIAGGMGGLLARTMALRRDLRRFSLTQVKSGVPAMKPTAPMARILPMRLGERPKVPPM